MNFFNLLMNNIFLSTVIVLFTPLQPSSLLGVTKDALKPWAGLLFIFSASYLFLRIMKQVYVFLVYRRQEKKATSAIWNELEEDAIIQEKVKGKKPEVEEEEEMDLLNT